MRTDTTPAELAGDIPHQGSDGLALTDEAIGAAIRARRQNAGQLLEQTADRSGISLQVLSRIERGERPCRVAEMVSLAEVLHTSPNTLLRSAAAIQRHGSPAAAAQAAADAAAAKTAASHDTAAAADIEEPAQELAASQPQEKVTLDLEPEEKVALDPGEK